MALTMSDRLLFFFFFSKIGIANTIISSRVKVIYTRVSEKRERT